MQPYLDRQKILYPAETSDTKIAGVHVVIYTPKDGISARNRDRVLIELHGGGFSGCWPGCAELESMPIASLGRIKVMAVDYREGPDHKFPSASEDVASVYQELLKTYPSEDIGLYGCSCPSRDSGGRRPGVKPGFHPVWNWNGSYVAALADEIGDDPVFLPAVCPQRVELSIPPDVARSPEELRVWHSHACLEGSRCPPSTTGASPVPQ